MGNLPNNNLAVSEKFQGLLNFAGTNFASAQI
jgi:hypothetical protein